MEIYKAPEARGIAAGEWTLQTYEVDIEREGFYQDVPIAGEPHHPVEFKGLVYPQHVQAQYTRISDGLEIVIEVRTTHEDGPIALAYSVTPPNGVRDDTDDRLPIRTMAQKAARSHGIGVEAEPVRHQYQTKDPNEKDERLHDIDRWWHEAKAQKLKPAPYIRRRMDREYGHTRSISRINHLIGDAVRAGVLDKSKGANK